MLAVRGFRTAERTAELSRRGECRHVRDHPSGKSHGDLAEVYRLHQLLVEGNGEVAGINAEAISILRELIREVIVHPGRRRRL